MAPVFSNNPYAQLNFSIFSCGIATLLQNKDFVNIIKVRYFYSIVYFSTAVQISKILARDSTLPKVTKVGIPRRQLSLSKMAAPPELPCSTLAEVMKWLPSKPETMPSVAVKPFFEPMLGEPSTTISSPKDGFCA